MSEDLFTEWSHPRHDPAFLCHQCAFSDDVTYDARGALNRIHSALDRSFESVQRVVRSEDLLHRTYNVKPPAPSKDAPLQSMLADDVSISILEMFHPVLLKNHLPIVTGGDGSCMYRAVSLGLYGTQDHHILIRLLSVMELVKNPSFYDTLSAQYVDLIQDAAIVVDLYNNLLRSACRHDGWSELMHVYATSAALSTAICSYCPPNHACRVS